MKVLSNADIARELASRTKADSSAAEGAYGALIDLVRLKLMDGVGVKLESFAEIQVYDKDGRISGEPFRIPSDEAASDVAGSFGGDAAKAGGFLSAAVSALREALLGGDKVEISGLVTLGVAEEKASISKTEGGRTITPARKVLSFSIDPGLKNEVGAERKIAFLPDPVFRDQISRLKASNILLIVPEHDFFAKTLEFHFKKAGWNVTVFTDSAKALEQIEKGETYQVIMDDPMPDSQKVVERLKCRMDTARVPLILMLPSGQNPNRTSSFRIMPDQSVVQPFEVKALLDKAENELARMSEEEAIFRQEVHFQFATVDVNIDRANEIAAGLFEHAGLQGESLVGMCAAFREGVGNAVQHGNRHRRDKVIDVLYLVDHEKITVNVTDEGEGFDHRLYTQRGASGNALAAARERHQQGRLGGLGIMLMMKCSDKIEYNEAGNSVTLTKMIPKPVPVAAGQPA